MFKKIIIGSVVTVGLAFLFLGPAVVSHARHAFGAVRDGVQGAFPIEYELQRAESMIRDVGPEIEKAKRSVAEEQVEIGYLEQEINRLEKRVGDNERKVKLQNTAMKTGEKAFTFAGRQYTRGQMENDLRLTFDEFKNDQQLIDGKKKLLEARTSSLQAAIQKLETVRSQESQLRANVESLRARLRQTQAMENCGDRITLDDGALAQAKEILARCRKRIDVAAKVVENEGTRPGSIPVDAMETRDITAEVDHYFSAPPTVPAPAANASETTAKVNVER